MIGVAGGAYARGVKDLQHQGAFVLQFRAGSDLEARNVEGRVEHVASGESVRFDSVEELLAFMARVLKEVHNSRRPDGSAQFHT